MAEVARTSPAIFQAAATTAFAKNAFLPAPIEPLVAKQPAATPTAWRAQVVRFIDIGAIDSARALIVQRTALSNVQAALAIRYMQVNGMLGALTKEEQNAIERATIETAENIGKMAGWPGRTAPLRMVVN